MAGVDDGQLDELRFHWGKAYDLAMADGVCTARRRDGRGGTLADPLPEGLRLRIAADRTWRRTSRTRCSGWPGSASNTRTHLPRAKDHLGAASPKMSHPSVRIELEI